MHARQKSMQCTVVEGAVCEADTDVCFVERVKAFDKVQHKAVFEMLDMLDVDEKEIVLILNY